MWEKTNKQKQDKNKQKHCPLHARHDNQKLKSNKISIVLMKLFQKWYKYKGSFYWSFQLQFSMIDHWCPWCVAFVDLPIIPWMMHWVMSIANWMYMYVYVHYYIVQIIMCICIVHNRCSATCSRPTHVQSIHNIK